MIANYIWLLGEEFELTRFRDFVTSAGSEMDFEKIIPSPSQSLKQIFRIGIRPIVERLRKPIRSADSVVSWSIPKP